MRVLGNLLLLLLMVAFGIVIYRQFTTDNFADISPYQLTGENKPQQSQLYLFTQEKALEYTLSQSPDKLWLSSVALFSDVSGNTIQHDFELLFEAISEQGHTLKSRRLNFSARKADQVLLPDKTESIPEFFTPHSSIQVTAPQNIYLKIDERVKKVRVSLLRQSPQIANIGIRLYQKVQRSSRLQPIDSWERLSNTQRRKLTENFLYHISELSPQEKANLARYRWQPVIPFGTPSEEYVLTRLFRVPNDIIEAKQTLLDTQNHNADENRHVTFPIHEKGRYTLSATHLFGHRNFNLSLQWHAPDTGTSGNQTLEGFKTQRLEFSGNSISHILELERGLLDVTSSIPVSLELHSEDAFVIDHHHIAPVIMLDTPQPLLYSLVHSESHPTPLKINFQQYADSTIAPEHQGVMTVKLLEENKTIWQTFTLNINNEPANYEQMNSTEFFSWLSKKQESYIRVPTNITTLSISSNIPTLVGVYTRPESLATFQKLPEQYRRWFDYEGHIPDWYSIYPDNRNNYINQGKMASMRFYHQPLPLKEKDDIQWQFDSLMTQNVGITLHELMVQSSPLPNNAEYTPLYFQTLPLNHPLKVVKLPNKNQPTSLFFIKDNAQAEQISWSIDGQQQSAFWIAGLWGMVELPRLLENNNKIQLPTGNIAWYANGIENGIANAINEDSAAEIAGQQYVKRRTVALSQEVPVIFNLNKTSDKQVVSFSLYPTTGNPLEVLVELIRTNTNRPLYSDSHSMISRRFAITPSEAQSGYKLFSEQRIHNRETFYFTLGDDIPPQEVSIKVTLTNGDIAYINAVQKTLQEESIIDRFRAPKTERATNTENKENTNAKN